MGLYVSFVAFVVVSLLVLCWEFVCLIWFGFGFGGLFVASSLCSCGCVYAYVCYVCVYLFYSDLRLIVVRFAS